MDNATQELHRLEQRLLVMAPVGRDAELTARILSRAKIDCEVCADLSQLRGELGRGAAAVMVAQEVLQSPALEPLLSFIEGQPAWSDLPILIFLGQSAGTKPEKLGALVESLGNVTLLDRPLQPITMLSAARAALRARRRQYQARDELTRQLRAVRERDQFLAMLGHELRNPLASIVFAADTLESERREAVRRIEIIRRQARHLSRLVDDLLDVARVTTGKIVLRKERLEMNELCDRVFRSVEAKAVAGGIELFLTRSMKPIFISGDPIRLEQVIGNLVTNAIKYTPSGGKVELFVESVEGDAVVRVRDNGVGIARETLPHIFELFAQADRTLDRAQGGLGIGLTVVRSIVELHDGMITASSEGLGRGSEFVLTLPLLAFPNHVHERTAKVMEAASHDTHRVVVIEDNADARELISMILSADGHQVQAAEDGPNGVALAVRIKPDVALIDLGLPGLDGFGVARQVRAQLGPEVLLIAISGYGQEEDRRNSFDAGFDLHYLKPVDTERLLKLLSISHTELMRRKHEGSLARA